MRILGGYNRTSGTWMHHTASAMDIVVSGSAQSCVDSFQKGSCNEESAGLRPGQEFDVEELLKPWRKPSRAYNNL